MTPEQKADAAVDWLEAQSDQWATEVDLVSSIRHIAHISRLSQKVPLSAREKMIARQEQLLDALMRQAFIEGGFRVAEMLIKKDA